MRLHWLQHEVSARCPLCGKEGPKGAVLSTGHVLPGKPPVTLLRCPACGAAFLQDLNPPDYESDMAEMLDYYVEQGAGIDLIVAPLSRVPPGSVRRCLEIGGAFGFALDFSRHAFGWEVLEVDPSPLAAAGAEALELPVRRAYFSADLDLGPEPFGLAILSEVLEHVAEPHGLLAALRERLSPEGILILSTPNLAIVRPETEEGALGRALSPGLHLVLYDHRSLAGVLERAGFAAVLVEESPETLRAFAARSPEALARLRPADPDAERALLRRYLAARAAGAPPGSALACGFAYRLLKEQVNAGLYAEAVASREALARIYRERFGLDLERPAVENGRRIPSNLTGALFFSGILALNHLGRPDRAAASFAGAIAAGALLQAGQNPFGLRDGETEALLAQSRKHLPMALAAVEPERAADEIEALERTAPGAGLPPALLGEARAQTFIRLVNAGAWAAAGRLAAGVARQTGEVRPTDAETLDSLYCLGLLALHQERSEEAAQRFERARELAGAAENPWSARLREGLRLARAPLAGKAG
jgi:SAM-dependent methyltransferase